MEELLLRVTQQAMNYAIRSGITITATYAFSQSTRLLKGAEDSQEKVELQRLQQRLESKVMIISPAIDMIELISARGNTSLETAVTLTKSLRWDIQALGREFAAAAAAEPQGPAKAAPAPAVLRRLITQIKQLLARIEDAVPLLSLAITTSGANLTTTLPHGVSPSRLLQASTFVTAGDTQYAQQQRRAVQVGPTFTLSLYMLFAGHVRPTDEEQVRRTTWKEVLHKARVKLMRVPLDALHVLPGAGADAAARADEFAYQMLLVEDLDDGRVHDEAEDEAYDDVARAGIREPIPVHQISKIFYADTGKILNIGGDGEANNPVLLLKRDLRAVPPRRMLDRSELEWAADDGEQSEIDAQLQHESRHTSLAPEEQHHATTHRLPSDLDPEWLALEVYTEDAGSDTASDTSDTEQPSSPPPSASPVTASLADMHLQAPSTPQRETQLSVPPPAPMPAIRTSLSLLETMLRLLSLQQFQQQPHLAIPDEFLSFFLSEAAATTGAAHGDEGARRRMRATAVRDLGFDPYDESPIRRRGEAGIGGSGSEAPDADWVGGGEWGRSAASSRVLDGPDARASMPPSPLVGRGGGAPGRGASRGASGPGESPLARKSEGDRKGSPLVQEERVESIEGD